MRPAPEAPDNRMSDDPQFERLLRSGARRPRPAGPCPDAGTLAAYADASLAPAEREELERHASSCARCGEHLALLAATADTDPPDTRAATAVTGIRRWGWLVPVATAVIVAAVWTRMPAPERPPPPAPSDAQAPAKEPSADSSVPEPPSQSPASPLGQRRADDGPLRFERPAPQAEPPSPSLPKASGDELARRPPAPPAAAPAQDELAKGQEEFADARQRSAGRAVGGREEKEAARPEARRQKATSAGALAETAWTVIAAGSAAQIRFHAGAIERSTDGGQTWTLELTEPNAGLRVVVCPSTDVCWAGGDAGLVLHRSSTGEWTRHRLPAPLPVTAIQAEGAASATATLADGRRFSTADGGKSWVSTGF